MPVRNYYKFLLATNRWKFWIFTTASLQGSPELMDDQIETFIPTKSHSSARPHGGSDVGTSDVAVRSYSKATVCFNGVCEQKTCINGKCETTKFNLNDASRNGKWSDVKWLVNL